MKLIEMFDKDKALADFEKDRQASAGRERLGFDINADSNEPDIADDIITRFERGEMSYAKAKQQLIAADREEWVLELAMAAELMQDARQAH